MPDYLHYIQGWDRVLDSVPSKFDASIIVDTSASSLLQKLEDSGSKGWVASKPCIVLDHHAETENDINYANLIINRPDVSSTGELIYTLAKQISWPIDVTAGECIMHAILGDTQGLSNSSASANTYRVMAELTDIGVSRPKLEEARREASKMDPRIFRYKAELIARTELSLDDQLALVSIPQAEINAYSPLYNPAPLIQGDMLQTTGVRVAVVIKQYDDGKLLGSIRCNYTAPVASDLALHFGGGGHAHAAGFKIQSGRLLSEVTSECASITEQLLNNLPAKD
jgi:phosphoesterase RecJ-like protein